MNTDRAVSAWTAHLPRYPDPSWLSARPPLTPPYQGGERGRQVPPYEDGEITGAPFFPPLDEGSRPLFPPLDKGGSGGVLSRGLARPHNSSVTRSNRGTIVVIALTGWLLVGAQPAATSPRPEAPPAPSSSTPAPEPSPGASSAAEPLERQPYRIVLHFACDPSARLDAARRADLLRDWLILVRRFVGAPWVVSLAPPSSPIATRDLDSLNPSVFANVTAFDKVWVVHAECPDAGSGPVFTGREYDTATRRLGPLQRRAVEVLADAPRALLEFTLDLFSPTAMITGQEGGRALLTVRAAGLEPASPAGRVVTQGTVFEPLRLVSLEKGVVVRNIRWTYLPVESVEGAVARCAIISAYSDPLTQRVTVPNTLAGVGIKPGKSPVRLRFVTNPDQRPAAGYLLTARLVPDGPPRELGLTDRAGRIVLPPGFASGLVILRLLAGNVEPMVERPVMPGESDEERVIAFDPKPMTVALEAQVDSLRDEVLDLVAIRARLEARMKARLEGNDWPGLEATITEASKLPPKDEFAKRLAALKDQAARQQAESKTAVLTRTAQAQINDLQAVIDRYLDDETLTAYRDALERGRADLAAKEKARAQAEAQERARRIAPPPPVQTQAAQPAPPAPAQPKPQPKPAAPPAPPTVPF